MRRSIQPLKKLEEPRISTATSWTIENVNAALHLEKLHHGRGYWAFASQSLCIDVARRQHNAPHARLEADATTILAVPANKNG
jgi:hypothetical protein